MMHRTLSQVVVVSAIAFAGVAGAAPKPIKPLPTISGVADDSVKVASRVKKLLPASTLSKAQVSGKAFAGRALERTRRSSSLRAATSTRSCSS